MSSFHTTPVHSGEVLKDELDELSLSEASLAKHIDVSIESISKICKGDEGLNALMAMKLSRTLGASPQFWLNLQNNWELSQINSADYEAIDQIAA